MKPNIIVIGDIILDHNIYCNIIKIANEKPIPVFKYNKEEYKLGGCGNVINNLDSLGCNKLFTLYAIGTDSSSKIILNLLNNINNLEQFIFQDATLVTNTKKRYFSRSDLLFRIDNENKSSYNNNNIYIYILEQFKIIIEKNNIDCVIFSDYSNGVLNEELCQEIIRLCNKKNINTVIDPKDNFLKYKDCTIIKPNKLEASNFLGNITSIDYAHKELMKQLKCKYSLITLSENGLSLYDGNKIINSNYESNEVNDVTGAGDIVTAVFAFYINSINIDTICKYANYLATHSVKYLGVYKITQNDIINARNYYSNTKQIYFKELQMLPKNKKIVFTNGCFDLLHTGHIHTLKFAKNQGDILIVGLNSDKSIKRLKGESRPIHNQNTRLQVLSSIYAIDYVILFDEDTPLNIIRELKPNILVKGGDYNIDNIIGKEYVDNIIIAPFQNGISTTITINNISNLSI
jgi:D-beta-D-heptose 7-phosphate kinase/D-beta-D-heptose 1-phosphate adenosyltransferase